MTVAQPLPTDLPCRPMICEPRPDDRGLGGLVALAAGAERALPLREVRARASIAGGCCRTVIEQTFENTLDTPMEAVHLFPLPEDGAVTEVELVCGELVVRAECKERQEAQAVFDRARQDGHRAALLTQERDDVHTLRVTNLPPGEAVRVRIVVVENLPSVDGRWRWRFPTTVPPRYLPGDPTGHAGPGVLPDTDAAPDASRLQPPLRLAGGTRLDLEVAISGAVSHLESSLHALKLDLGGTLRVAPSGTATLDRDFVLAFSTGDDQATAARAWTDGRFTLVTVDPPVVAMPDALPRDAVFVLDISGSMGGAKLDAAKQALTGALHGLVPGDRFLLIAFDDRLEFFQQGFSDYNDRTLAQADRWIGNLSARGGTEMLPAIAAALKGEPPEGRLRTVLFITDGQAWNEDQLVAAVAGRRKRSLFFTLGIDTAVNGAMLKRLARAGGGTCELATPQDDIDGIIANLEARFGSPVAEGVRPRGFQAASLGDAELFTGRPAALLFEGSPESVVIEGRSAEGAFTLSAAPLRVDFPLGALWARRRVAALQDRLTLRPFEEEMLRPDRQPLHRLRRGRAQPGGRGPAGAGGAARGAARRLGSVLQAGPRRRRAAEAAERQAQGEVDRPGPERGRAAARRRSRARLPGGSGADDRRHGGRGPAPGEALDGPPHRRRGHPGQLAEEGRGGPRGQVRQPQLAGHERLQPAAPPARRSGPRAPAGAGGAVELRRVGDGPGARGGPG
jgi:Ca-activated chloride channel family protein